MGIGVAELLVVVPIALLSIALPVVALVGVVLIYRKLSYIEQLLIDCDRKER